MADTIGVKIGVEGEKEFKNALADINMKMKTLGSEMSLVDAKFSKTDKSEKALTARSQVLSKQIQTQKDKISILEKALQNSATSFGENVKRTQTWQQKLNEAKASLLKMEGQLSNVTNATGDFSDELEENSKQANKSASANKNAADIFSSLGSVCKGVAIAVTGVSAALSAVAIKASKELINCAKEGATYADTVLTEAAVTGIATDKLQEYMYAAELIDVSTDTLTKSMAKNIKSMKSATDGSTTYKNAYEALGVAVTNADGSLRDSDEVYWEIIDALGQIENETERDALAMEILGKSAQELNPLITAGADSMKALGDEAKEMGYVLSDDLLTSYGAYDDAIQRFNNGTTAAKNALGIILLPVLTKVTNEGVSLLGEFSTAILDCGGDIEKIGEVIDSMLPEILSIFEEYIPVLLSLIGSALKSIGLVIVNNIQPIINSALDVLKTLVSALFDSLPQFTEVVIKIVKTIGQSLIENIPILLNAIELILSSLVNSINTQDSYFLSMVLDLANQIISMIGNIAPLFIDALINLLDGIINALDSGFSNILKTITNVIEKIILKITNILPSIIIAITKIIKSIANALVGAIPQLVSSIGKIIPVVISTILSSIPSFINAISEILEGIISMLPEIITNILSMLSEILPAVIDSIMSSLPEIINAVITLTLGLIDALPEIITILVSMIPDIFNEICTAIIDSSPLLLDSVLSLVFQLIEHIPEIVKELVTSIPEIISAIVTAFSDLIPQMVEVGVNLLKGLWEGIKSTLNWLKDKVKETGNKVVDWFKDVFGINSPSTVFASLGDYMAQGLGNGFVDSMNVLEKEIVDSVPTDFDIDAKAHIKDVALDTNNQVANIEGAMTAALKTTSDNSSGYSFIQIIATLREQNTYLRQLVEKELSISIGDEAIGLANDRYTQKRGLVVNEGGFKNAY